MPVISALFTFTQAPSYGWSEKYYKEVSSTRLNDHFAACVELHMKRMKLCGGQTATQYLRLSVEGVRGDSFLWGWPAGSMPGTLTETSEDPNTCLLVQCRDSTTQFRKLIFLRGIWDSIVADGGLYKPTPLWNELLNAWTGELRRGGWGWLATTQKRRGLVQTYTQLPNGLVRFTMTADFWQPGEIGVSVAARASKINDRSNLNGPIVLVPESATTAVTLRRTAALPFLFGGVIEVPSKTLKTIDSLSINRVGRHDTGRPILQPRGRSKNRIKG